MKLQIRTFYHTAIGVYDQNMYFNIIFCGKNFFKEVFMLFYKVCYFILYIIYRILYNLYYFNKIVNRKNFILL